MRLLAVFRVNVRVSSTRKTWGTDFRRRSRWISSLQSSLMHRPLNERKAEIRLLEIDPTSEILSGTLHHFSCDEKYPEYIALSYCWGDPADTRRITIDGSPVDITKNLANALLQLRKQTRSMIWVDALCINQSDNVEKGRQVSRMGEIYRHGVETVAWLGMDNEGEAEAMFGLLKLWNCKAPLSEYETSLALVSGPISVRRQIPQWSAFRTMLAMPYWARIWIIQELALSRTAYIQWGEQRMSLDTFCGGIFALRIQKPNSLLEVGFRQIVSLLRIVGRIRRHRVLSLQEVLAHSCSSLASEPRDKIFAALGLSFDGPSIIKRPDYQKPMDSILLDIASQRLILDHKRNRSRPMDLICIDNPTVPKRPDFPSWVTHWPSLWKTRNGELFMSELNRGLRDGHSACGDSLSSVKVSTDGRVLTVSGYVFDGIGSLSAPVQLRKKASQIREPIPTSQDCVLSANPYGGDAEVREAVWRVLVRNRVPMERGGAVIMPDASVAAHFSKIWDIEGFWAEALHRLYSTQMGGLRDFRIHGRTIYAWSMMHSNSNELSAPLDDTNIDKKSGPEQTTLRLFVEEVTLKLITLRNRVLVTEKGYIGLGHARAQLGDVICLLQGASLPTILRPCEDGYRIVGEAYVHGIMDGQFWEAQDQSKMQEFHLV